MDSFIKLSNFGKIAPYAQLFRQGLLVTVLLSMFTVAIGFVLALILALMDALGSGSLLICAVVAAIIALAVVGALKGQLKQAAQQRSVSAWANRRRYGRFIRRDVARSEGDFRHLGCAGPPRLHHHPIIYRTSARGEMR